MYRNALEDELKLQALRLASFLRDRDRGVLLGLLFCIIPIPPATLAGLLVTILNLRLLARGRLPQRERRLVWISLTAGLASLVVGVMLFGWIAMIALRLPNEGTHFIHRLMNFLFNSGTLQPAIPQGMQQI